jgi:hypothetical protein
MTDSRKTKPEKPNFSPVDVFMQALDHPLTAEVQAVRSIVLGINPEITEGIKWNAPSFACKEHFATFNLRVKEGVCLVLHFGAKVNDISTNGVVIADPTGMLHWLAKDRALVKFQDMQDIKSKSVALETIVRQWIRHVQ